MQERVEVSDGDGADSESGSPTVVRKQGRKKQKGRDDRAGGKGGEGEVL